MWEEFILLQLSSIKAKRSPQILLRLPPVPKTDSSLGLSYDSMAALRNFDYGKVEEDGRSIREFKVTASSNPLQLNDWNLNNRVRIVFHNEDRPCSISIKTYRFFKLLTLIFN